MNVCRRSMQPYFELYQRITERSEVFTPWGFPPLYQFEERLMLLERLRPFARNYAASLTNKRLKKTMRGAFLKYYSHRIRCPPTYKSSKNYMGNNASYFTGVIPD